MHILSILKAHFRAIASIEKNRIKRYLKATEPLRTSTCSPLVLAFFQGIAIKNDILHTVVSGRIDAYGTGILAELDRLIKEVENFIAIELKEGVKGGKEVARRKLKFQMTQNLLTQSLRGGKHVNWVRDRVALEFCTFFQGGSNLSVWK
jgi:hypothetical protein